MKSLFKNIYTAIAMVAILFSGCKNPAEDVKIIVDSDIFKAPVLVTFVNAKPGGNTPKDFTVNIIGPNADLVRTTTGGRVFKSSQGLLNLVLDRNANPTMQNPVRYTLVVEAPGFAPTFKDIELISTAVPVIVKIPLTEYANPAQGTGVLVTTNTIANGSSTGELTFVTGTNAGMAEKSKLSVVAGTGFMDAAGQVITGNQVDTKIAYLGKQNNGTGSIAIPGGTVLQKVVTKDGKTIEGGVYFDPIVAVTIDMAVGGKEVKKFSKPLGLDIELKPQTVSENTGALIKEGDILALWSLDNNTGIWKADGNASVIKNSEGKLVARTQINHLSTYALFAELNSPISLPVFTTYYVAQIYWIDLNYRAALCVQTVTIERADAEIEEIFEVSTSANTTFVTMPKGTKTTTILHSNGRMRPYSPNAPENILTVTGPAKYEPVTISDASCATDATVKMVAKPDLVNIAIDFKFKCSNKNLLTGVNCFVTVKPVGTDGKEGAAMIVQLVNGIASTTAIIGATYHISTEIDGISYSTKFTADKTNFALPGGSQLSGSVNYNPTSNTLNILGVVSKNCK